MLILLPKREIFRAFLYSVSNERFILYFEDYIANIDQLGTMTVFPKKINLFGVDIYIENST